MSSSPPAGFDQPPFDETFQNSPGPGVTLLDHPTDNLYVRAALVLQVVEHEHLVQRERQAFAILPVTPIKSIPPPVFAGQTTFS